MDAKRMGQAARSYWQAGLSVLPASKAMKRPVIGSWKTWTQRLPTEIEIEAWFSTKHDALALVAGKGFIEWKHPLELLTPRYPPSRRLACEASR